MKVVKAILISLLVTATLVAATDSRLSLWVSTVQMDPYTLTIWYDFENPVPGITRGCAFDNGHIWLHTQEIGETYYYYEIDLEGNIITSFPSPEPDEGQGVNIGIDVDGDYLWIICNGYIYHVTKTGTIVSPAPFYVGLGINDLAWDGEYLWVAYGEAFTIAYYKYNVNTGGIVDAIGGLVGSMPETPSIAVDSDGYIYCLYCDRMCSGGGYYYIFEPNGDDLFYFLDDGFLNHGIDVGEWPVTSIISTSLGTIKALYK
jgi:hypothetical protein